VGVGSGRKRLNILGAYTGSSHFKLYQR
jgi:hypothetical protein